ncbi:aspartic peptidase A1 [Sistotremastrum suecicum HHB10207 ss-3]|uniref:Aspartic peptidase A1 n=1 Tax=Sistotremastrum suecicum HHB10207 ss-3 TaxID=1314776 RepID=A0A165XVX9_9AGAM|nr:aspartic peptidase A1 [Sistotremastrum suecicum HHB10207 ss-3]
MTKLSVLLSALLTLTVVLASPVVQIRDSIITIPIAKKIVSTGSRNFVEAERARAQGLIARGKAKAAARARGESDAAVGNIPVTNQAVTYVSNVGVGSPPTQYELLIDTGSSNTWVGAGTAYKKTSTSVNTGKRVSVTYGSGSFSGTEYLDTVSLGPSLVIQQQSIGVASTSSGFDGVDGILGIGPVDLTEGTVSGENSIPTVTDNLFARGIISSNEIGISFEPTTTPEVTNGELTFGGIDSTKFTSSITYAPITSTSPAGEFWGIDQSISYGTDFFNILPRTAGIVDTGTTLILLATNAFELYKLRTGATEDSSTGLLKISNDNLGRLKNLNFHIQGVTFELTPNAQLFPHSLNTDIGGSATDNYLIVNDLGTPSGEGLDFINGYAFLERFYSVYDTANQRVGFATTPFTDATTN